MSVPLPPDALARVLDHSSDVVARFDRAYRHLYVNAAITRYTGLPAAHFIGRSHRELGVSSDDAELWESRIRECFDGREVRFQLTLNGRLGQFVHDVHLLPERDAQGLVQSVVGIGHDVSVTHIEAERERLAAILQHVADGLIVADRPGRVLDMNAAALRLHGFAAVEDARVSLARYDELFQIRTPAGEVLTSDRCPLARALRGEVFSGVELRVLRLDTGHGWIGSFSGASVAARDGTVSLAIVTVHDVTARRQLETELREREERYRLVTEAMNGLVYDWHVRDGTVTRSLGLRDLLGYHPDEVPAGQAWWLDQIHPDDRAGVTAAFEQVVRQRGAGMKRDFRVRSRAGAWVWVWDHSRVLYDEDGTPERVLGCTVSVDARKRAEERLLEMDRLKDQFLMMLGHELRQPLHALQAATQVVRLTAESDRMDRPIAIIERQIRHLTRLVEDLGDVSRVKRGKLRITEDVIDVREAVESAVEAMRARVEGDGQQLRWDPPGDPVRVRGDRARLQQVVLNLLSNANGHTPAGGTISVTLSCGDHEAELRVCDTGAGITGELLPHVFDLFVQGSDREPSGMGIGLALVKGLVELHGGTVDVTSEGPGRGSAFRITLPLARADTRLPGTRQADGREADSHHAGARRAGLQTG